MKNVQRGWEIYRNACYPTGLGPAQEAECKQAFFAGMLVAFQAMSEISEKPEEEAMTGFRRLELEIVEANRQCVQKASGGN